MDYWDIRTAVKKLVPRKTLLEEITRVTGAIKEKGRKTNYHEFRLDTGKFEKHERLLNMEEIRSFMEISLRAAACPMPFNLDVWDGLHCGFGCRYCYADNFRASLYTSFFDNPRSIGMRHCDPDHYKTELDKLMPLRGQTPKGNEYARAIALGIPMRLGIRFEDFLPIEAKKGISLQLMRYLADADYPLMINSKSDLLARDDYLKALTDNKAGTAVHITMISSNNDLLKRLEPGAPPFERRLKAAKTLADAGVRVVARIEPYMTFLNDHRDEVEEYMDRVWDAGVRNITFDNYSYSANNPGIRQAFLEQGYDFERMFLLSSDSQPLSSLLLGTFIDVFRDRGFRCSTFDMGNVPANEDAVCCCEVGDWFKGHVGFNHGSAVRAVRFIQAADKPVSWSDYEQWVDDQGGFLSDKLKDDMHRLWNLDGNRAFFIDWAPGIEACGYDRDGLIWTFNPQQDFRKDILEVLT